MDPSKKHPSYMGTSPKLSITLSALYMKDYAFAGRRPQVPALSALRPIFIYYIIFIVKTIVTAFAWTHFNAADEIIYVCKAFPDVERSAD